MNRIKTLWTNKRSIINGYFNRLFASKKVKAEAKKRLAICRANRCGYYDPKGESKNAFIKGVESCGGCGCVLKAKVFAVDVECYLGEIGEEPLWTKMK